MFYMPFPFVCAELLYGTKVTVTGDRFPKEDNCVILMNHRTQMDWILQWSFLARRGNIGANKISLKNSLRYFPGAGKKKERDDE